MYPTPAPVHEAQLQELVCHLWDNYLQPTEEQSEIYLIGVGNAYVGVKQLLMARGDSKHRIAGIVNFVSGTLRHIKSDVDPDLSNWYKNHSQVYIQGDHICFRDPILCRKVMKRRFGTVLRSSAKNAGEMMQLHADDVKLWIMNIVESTRSGDTTENE